ncbi:enoyl-CoA hydratase/isomerase family protein [Ramlibacter sp. G-1-2-2]|uniref:Enoyl-CoA hydratase/isomerase family protein n=1 Tax=Ramlibacter agri TaxID=2728837 RepID=A0A848H8F3_9BURK|nr:enoyl-CoA hydratase/isomerase family protein [Ramlibacter agri]NML46747.1 enoyl-CoA hydratase/isomerase family protein [Ramlibacter agri]
MTQGEGIARIRLDRPEKGNALSTRLVAALAAHVADAVADPRVHTIVFSGEGRHFCTGFDLSDLETASDADLLQRFVQIELLLDAVWRAPVRTVALAQGRTWGAGADLFAACDVRLAAPDATFRFPGAGFGLVLGTRRLAVRVGRDEARRLTCDGGSLDQAQALRTGLASAGAEAGADSLAPWLAAPAVDRATVAALRAATADAGSDADLAALVRSAARPGLKERIVAHRARTLAAKAAS